MRSFAVLAATAALCVGAPAFADSICHKTSSKTNTFVMIDVATSALSAHVTNHGDTFPMKLVAGCDPAEKTCARTEADIVLSCVAVDGYITWEEYLKARDEMAALEKDYEEVGVDTEEQECEAVNEDGSCGGGG